MAQSKIPKRFIGPLDNTNIEAGANIASSKLADGANFINKNGSVLATGSQNMGGFEVLAVGTATQSTSAVNKGQMDNAIASLNSLFSSKGSARAMATGNILVSNPGTAIFDTVTLVTGDRLFLGNQSAPAENGLYVFNSSGTALIRTADTDIWDELQGALFSIEEGSANISKLILFTVPKAGTINTTAISFQVVNAAGLTGANFVSGEVLSGVVNGSNTAFIIANTPVVGSVDVILEGIILKVGTGNDYTITGAAITMLAAPLTGELLTCNYRK